VDQEPPAPPTKARRAGRLGHVTATGSADSRLVVVRGNSASGKSSLARSIRSARPRGIAVLGQDQLRREILHAREEQGNPTVDYLDLSARFALDRGLHVRRHAGKPQAAESGADTMRGWWRSDDALPGVGEQIIGADASLADTTARVLSDCRWTISSS
jgi:chloramphenicol 3-O-phosphotransferase